MLVAAILLLLLSVFVSREIEEQKGQAGVRFTKEGIDAKQIGRIYEEEEQEDLPWLTLWRCKEGADICKTDGSRRATVKLVELWGDVEHIYPKCLAGGSPLSKEDKAGCMLSGKAAFEVFGSEDVIGKQVVYENCTYEVRGLLDVEDKLFVRQQKEGLFSYMEAEGCARGGMEPVREILLQAGVSPKDGAVLEWDFIRGLLHLFGAFGAGLLELAAVRWFSRRYKGRRILVWCVRAGAAALFVLVLVKGWCFSQEVIPGSWSDFAFFGNLFQEQLENYKRYLDVPDIFKDRQLFWELRLALGCIAGSAVLSVICLFQREKETSENIGGTDGF